MPEGDTEAQVMRAIPVFAMGGAFALAAISLVKIVVRERLLMAGLQLLGAAALLLLWWAHRAGRLAPRYAQPILVANFSFYALLTLISAEAEPRPYVPVMGVMVPLVASAFVLGRRWLAAALAVPLLVLAWQLPLVLRAWGPSAATVLVIAGTFIPFVVHETRLRAHEALAQALADERRAAAMQRALFEDCPLPKWVYDDHTLEILDVNRAATLHYGYTREQFLSMTLLDLRPPEDVPAFLARRKNRDSSSVRHVQARHVKADGTRIDVLVTAAPLRHERQTAVIASAQDVTETLRSEEALRQSQKRFELLAKATRDVVWDWDAETGKVWRNENHDIVFGREESSGDGYADWLVRVHPDDRARVTEDFMLALAQSDDRWEGEYRYRRVGGGYAKVYDRGYILRDASAKAVRVVGSMQDVTAMRRTQEDLHRQERLSSLGTLVAGVAHEINNPLTYMRGTVELTTMTVQDLLADPALPAPARESLADIEEGQSRVLFGIDQVGRIARSLRQVARADDGERSAQDVNALVQNVVDVARTRTKGDVELDISLHAKRRIDGSATGLSQVVLNLLFNAADAVAGRPEARIAVRTRDEGDDVVVEVEDNGEGIAPEVAARLFTPFLTTKPEGTGLGLSVSYAIAREHGGSLTFHSERGAGSTFRLALPALSVAAKH